MVYNGYTLNGAEVTEVLEDEEGVLGLPSKFKEFRPHQPGVVAKMTADLISGKDFVVAEMPTGSGKTMIAMAVRQTLETQTLYVCTTKTLQDQFLKDFPAAKLIKGRGNYACGQVPNKFPEITADDCPAKKCSQSCPYMLAKTEALKAEVCVMNMAYFLSEIQHIGKFRGRGLVIIDESDTLEDALLEQVSVTISMADIQMLKLGEPEFKTKFEAWQKWAEGAREIVIQHTAALASEIENYTAGEEEDWSTAPLTLLRKKKRLERMISKLSFFLKNVDKYWVWEKVEGYSHYPNVRGTNLQKYSKWVFKPVRVDQFGDIVFLAAEKFILMSATILDFFQYERNIGLAKYRQDGKVGTVKVGSVFDPRLRPTYVLKGPDLTFKNKAVGLKELPAAVKIVLDKYPNDKGVIHAVSYEVAKTIAAAFPARAIVHTSGNRREVIEEFKASTKPLVLVSPSADRGEDFPDEMCRFIVIVKIPYPYLGDERIKRRLYHKDGQKWYTLKTISKIVQMTGRGMRHEDDQCDSYILDPGFRKLYMENRSMFPTWWKEALIWEGLMEKGGKRVNGTEGKEELHEEEVHEEDQADQDAPGEPEAEGAQGSGRGGSRTGSSSGRRSPAPAGW